MVDTVVGLKDGKPISITECNTDFEIAHALLHLDDDVKEVNILLNTKVMINKKE